MCANCDREARADLANNVSRGLGDVPVTHLRFRCSACGSTTVHPQLSSASADRYRPRTIQPRLEFDGRTSAP